jgi:hypothetical protein
VVPETLTDLTVGAVGTPPRVGAPTVTSFDKSDSTDVPPSELTDATVKRYVTPEVRPETVMERLDAPLTLPVRPPGVDVATYPLMSPLGEEVPPKVTVAVVPVTFATIGPGTTLKSSRLNVILIGDEAADAAEVPARFSAVTVNVYSAPSFLRPSTVMVPLPD